jgi:hypothetical protein
VDGPAPEGSEGISVDGGIGRDILAFTMAGDLTTDILPNLSYSDIEAIDIENGLANQFSLGLEDLRGLSGTGDSWLLTELGLFDGDPNIDSATIYGDALDTLTLSNAEGDIILVDTISDGINDFHVYEFRNASDEMTALLAVDDDVMVLGATLITA